MHGDLFWETGSASVRAQIGITPEDPKVFHPYTVDECLWCARVLGSDMLPQIVIARLLPLGLIIDLMPSHLMPSVSILSLRLRRSPEWLRRSRLQWECVDPVIRFALVRKSVAMILMLRGAKKK